MLAIVQGITLAKAVQVIQKQRSARQQEARSCGNLSALLNASVHMLYVKGLTNCKSRLYTFVIVAHVVQGSACA